MEREKERILVVDDDADIRTVLSMMLGDAGYEVAQAKHGMEALDMDVEQFDLILLDVMMPHASGFDICAKMRERTNAPIVFLTAKSQDSDKQKGFQRGGDDYLVKPFSKVELLSRVQANLRRYLQYGTKEEKLSQIIEVKGMRVDLAEHSVFMDHGKLALTDKEWNILLLLLQKRGEVLSIQQIYEAVWQEKYFYTSNNTVMVHMRNLRRKLERKGDTREIIRTVWGHGYVVD